MSKDISKEMKALWGVLSTLGNHDQKIGQLRIELDRAAERMLAEQRTRLLYTEQAVRSADWHAVVPKEIRPSNLELLLTPLTPEMVGEKGPSAEDLHRMDLWCVGDVTNRTLPLTSVYGMKAAWVPLLISAVNEVLSAELNTSHVNYWRILRMLSPAFDDWRLEGHRRS